MTLLSKCYNPSIYNSLGQIETNHQLVKPDHVRDLGDIIRKHGHQEQVALIIAHRHFDLLDTEAMLEKHNPPRGGTAADGADSNPVDAISVVRPAPMEEIERIGAAPNVLALGPDGVWHPVNYSLGKVKVPAWEDDAFLGQVSAYMADSGTAHLFMLGTFDPLPAGVVQLLETNDGKTRTSALLPIAEARAMPPDAIGTTFRFVNCDCGDLSVCCKDHVRCHHHCAHVVCKPVHTTC